MASIEWQDVTFHYPGSDTPTLSKISLHVRSGEFVVLGGPSGSGKTTLLRLLKREVSPGGRLSGAILLDGRRIEHMPALEAASTVGLVMQHPDSQLVVDIVEHELAFGMENFGMPRKLMRRRMAEITGFFGLEPLLSRSVDELSGGQKQMVNLAAVLMLQPKVLLLDEPLSQLDPLAARELLGMIKRLNDEWGITTIMSEHRMDDLLPLADRLVRLEQGAVSFDGNPRVFAAEAWRRQEPAWLEALPSVTRWSLAQSDGAAADRPPLSVKEARQWLQTESRPIFDSNETEQRGSKPADCTEQASSTGSNDPASRRQSDIPAALTPVSQPDMHRSSAKNTPLLEAKSMIFAYDKQSPAVLRGLTWTIRHGDRIALFGGNGSGKSTLLQLLAGLRQAQRGEVQFEGVRLGRIPAAVRYARIGYLAQNPLLHFAHDTLREDLMHAASRGIESAADSTRPREGAAFDSITGAPHSQGPAEAVRQIAERLGLLSLLDQHPQDLSGGERQLGALAQALLGKPQLLLLDEPTKGVDALAKTRLIRHLEEIHRAGTTLVIATHDVEFAAGFANRCALLFQGEIVADDTPEAFFQGNLFYATPLHRLRDNLPTGGGRGEKEG